MLLAMEISETTSHHVFIDYSGGTKSLGVRYYDLGFDISKNAQYLAGPCFYLDREGAIEKLIQVKQKLLGLLKDPQWQL